MASGLIDRTSLSAALSRFKTKMTTVVQGMIDGLNGSNIPLSSSDATTLASAISAKLNSNNSRLTNSGVFYTGSLSGSWGFGVCCQGRGFCVPVTCGGTITNISGSAFIAGSWVTLSNGSVISNGIQRYINFDQPSGMQTGSAYLCTVTCTVA